jgi:hypothetical protein
VRRRLGGSPEVLCPPMPPHAAGLADQLAADGSDHGRHGGGGGGQARPAGKVPRRSATAMGTGGGVFLGRYRLVVFVSLEIRDGEGEEEFSKKLKYYNLCNISVNSCLQLV